MSALSDFLTTATGPWWSSGLVGIAGTLLGIGANSRLSNGREQRAAERVAKEKLAQNELDDRRRWEVEIRDYAAQIDSSVDRVRGYTFRPVDENERNVQRQTVREVLTDLQRLRSMVHLIAPAELHDVVGDLHHGIVLMTIARDIETCEQHLLKILEDSDTLIKYVRTYLRIPNDLPSLPTD